MDRRQLTDPRALRAYAHPFRLTLIGLLRREGALTATRAAELTGESVASCSYHLRMLAKYGLTEQTGEGRGRQKPWRATTARTSWPGRTADPEAREAATAVSLAVVERYFTEAARWLENRPTEPADWQEAASPGDATIFVTAAELKELDEKVRELLQPYIRRADAPELRPAAARRVSYVHFGHPAREFGTRTRGEAEEPHA
ncbi:winged helix-turn-helix domain-containing protein [Streptomyces shenzhenensis]|uniref:winged helix-turn-helix domain-containing protein n=1 Tax=Streptomyces shenzhenensis TaxID=943815 RepID=UPI0015F013A6|nr:helix-turn-helix domain-containing protein [Streptomyces shenzhenensis]